DPDVPVTGVGQQAVGEQVTRKDPFDPPGLAGAECRDDRVRVASVVSQLHLDRDGRRSRCEQVEHRGRAERHMVVAHRLYPSSPFPVVLTTCVHTYDATYARLAHFGRRNHPYGWPS